MKDLHSTLDRKWAAPGRRPAVSSVAAMALPWRLPASLPDDAWVSPFLGEPFEKVL